MLKEGIRIIAFEDAPIIRKQGKCLVIGVIQRSDLVEGILSFYVGIDGNDTTKKIIAAITRSRFSDQIRLVALNGIALAGLNLIDIAKLNRSLKVPVVAVTRDKPSPEKLANAIRASGQRDARQKINLVNNIANAVGIAANGKYHIQYLGIEKKGAINVLEKSANALRLAHLIASGVATGESKGRM